MNTSTAPDEGFDEVDGVETTASMISGPVVYSWASGLFTFEISNLSAEYQKG
jgi:hypothetical protein